MKSKKQKEHSKEMYDLGYKQCQEDVLKLLKDLHNKLITPMKPQQYINACNDFFVKAKGEIDEVIKIMLKARIEG